MLFRLGRCRFDFVADDYLEVIRGHVIGADKIIVVGHSAGGALVQRYALAHIDRVEKMVLIEEPEKLRYVLRRFLESE